MSTPLIALSALGNRAQFLPGLPLASLAVICPAAAALVVSRWRDASLTIFGRARGPSAPATLIARAYTAAIVVPPIVAAASFAVQRFSAVAVPAPQTTLGAATTLAFLFTIAALVEELGWSALAFPQLEPRFGALIAGLSIGLVWSIWHYPALIEVGRSPAWIAWWTLNTVSMRLIMVRLLQLSGGSLAVATLFHGMANLCWQLYPVNGSWFDPRLNALFITTIAVILLPGLCRHPSPGIKRQQATSRTAQSPSSLPNQRQHRPPATP